ncbi:hypothetical protein B0J12DRAFT_154897 [Macrophomina phaseolina]|uniref:Uncharacterized protein n=1 Tax=Macrophomina phaseolina TaxID=35725 RepID=A0ABQ8G5E4_9PEZI|nr:hypothetical protein B0J12DRAFT_154897 [Macrophomina phaseolina]
MANRPYFVIAGLPTDDKSLAEYDIKGLYGLDSNVARDQLVAMHAALKEAGYGFSMVHVSPQLGTGPLTDALGQADHCDGVILGYGIRGHPYPQITALLEELIAAVRRHPKDPKILFNWGIPSTVDACKRALGQF